MVLEAMRLLEDPEVRVRLAVGQLLRSLAAKHGLTVLQSCQDTVLNSIHTHFVSGRRGRCFFSGGWEVWACRGYSWQQLTLQHWPAAQNCQPWTRKIVKL